VRALAAATVFVLVLVPAAFAATLDQTGFRYTRELRAKPGLALLEPDGPLYAHSRAGFADLRIVDADGRQVPWRRLPPLEEPRRTRVQLLNRGRQGETAVALIDLGPERRVHDRIELELPDRRFVGSVVVLGSDDRRRFTRLSETQIYDVRGARAARSTTAVFPPTDHRYLQLRAKGVSAIAGATVAFDPTQPRLRPVDADTTVRQRGAVTIVDLDLGFRNVPVDEIDVEATTGRFDRPVTVTGSNDGRGFGLVGSGRLTRFQTVSFTSIPVGARSRYLRVEIANGDDPPLAGLRVSALAEPRTLLLAPGFRPPYRLLYGDPALRAPRYDFAAVPPAELDLRRARVGRLAAEARNPTFEPPEDTRSFAARHPVVVQGALALAAIAVAGAGLVALRRRT
jgi:hypothetical protein